MLLAALPDAVLTIDARHNITYANHAAQALFNLGARAGGKTLSDVLGDAHPVLSMIDGIQKTQQGTNLHDTQTGGRNMTRISLMPLTQQGDMMLVFTPDMLHIRQGDVARTRAALKPAQQMARVLAHEIKNPLSGMRGAAQLLLQSGLGADDRELAALIERETARICTLLDKVNVFDTPTVMDKEPVNLHSVTDHVIRLAAAGVCAGMTIRPLYDPSLPDIEGQADALVQALLNLLKNAAEAGATDIAVRTSFDTAAGYHPDTARRLPVTIEVADNGCGIPADAAARLFEPYFTTKAGGEGIGLPIVSKIVDDHGGVIGVTSGNGRTVFRISLPQPERRKGSRA